MKRNALLFKAGDYTDKGITVTPDMLGQMEQNFSSVPIMLEHAPSPLDGHLGKLESIYRKGDELYGTLDIPDGIWEVIDSADAKKLSVSFLRNSLKLTEVSITDTPACEVATMFSFSINLKDSVAVNIDNKPKTDNDDTKQIKFSEKELKKQLEEISFKDVDLYSEIRSKLPEDCWIEILSIDYVVYSMWDSIDKKWKNFKVSYTITDGSIDMSEDVVEVTQEWTEVFNKTKNNLEGESKENMDDKKNPEVDNNDLQFKSDIKAEVAKQLELIETQKVEFAKQLEERDAEIKALKDSNKRKSIDAIVFSAIEKGQCLPAHKEVLTEILFNAPSEPISFNDEKTDLFGLVIKFLSENKVPVSFSNGKKVDADVSHEDEDKDNVLSMSEKQFCEQNGISEETFLSGKTAKSDSIDLSKGDN